MGNNVSRRMFLEAGAGAVGAVLLAAPAHAGEPQGAPGLVGERNATATYPAANLGNGNGPYANDINYALSQGEDLWGNELLGLADGPTLPNVRALLGPANIASQYVTESGWYYLPLTGSIPDPDTWLKERDFAIHVADGSQITSQWCWADYPAIRQYTNFQVGSQHEAFGSRVARLDAPRLFGGHLPILINSYVDDDGTRWTRESFVAKDPRKSSVISYVKFTAHRGRRGPAHTSLRLQLHVTDVDQLVAGHGRLTAGGNAYIISSGDGVWQSPTYDFDLDITRHAADLYLIVVNTPAPADGIVASARAYLTAKQTVARYWNGALDRGAPLEIPEPYASHAARNLLLQNLVMGWQQSIANGYEATDPTFAFVPEVSTSVAALGYFGYLDEYRANLGQILLKGQGAGVFPDWEMGIKLQSAADYYLLSNDGSYITDNLDRFVGYLDDLATQRAADPHGLVDKEQYASDIGYPVYGLHHQADCWRGLRDMGVALGLMGRADLSKRFGDEADSLRTSLNAAIEESAQDLPDGSSFVPISLLDPNAPRAWDAITSTRLGSYWNIIAPYALATGIFPPGSRLARRLLKYLNSHGSLILGLSRFNATGIDPAGICETDAVANFPPNAAGYDTPGIDEQYTYSLLRFLADNEQYDQIALSFYGMLGQGLTPHTFIGGEGATISPCPELPSDFRSQWFPPLSASNAVYLRALRELLLHEDHDDAGIPTQLHIAPAIPRAWLSDGQRVSISGMPTLFGPVSFSAESHLRRGSIRVTIRPPERDEGRAVVRKIWLHARVPSGYRVQAAWVGGRALHVDGEKIDLGAPSGSVTVDLSVRRVPTGRVDQARPTVVLPERLLFQPGTIAPLRVTVEALGAGSVAGELTVQTPGGWRAPEAQEFHVASSGLIARREVGLDVRIPSQVQPGTYTLTITAHPRFGTAQSRDVVLAVARPSRSSYRDLVLASGPAAYWRLDERSGSVAADSSGHGVDGTYVGAVDLNQPGAIADDRGGCVRLDGGYVLVPSKPTISLNGPYTLEAWVKVISAAQQGIIEKYDTPAYNGYLLRTVGGNKLYAECLTGALPLPPAVAGTTTLLPGLWHHVASVFDGGHLRIVLDGQPQGAIRTTAAPTPGTDSLKLGARGDDANARLDGWIGEVAIYDRALSDPELRSHFEKGVLGDRLHS